MRAILFAIPFLTLALISGCSVSQDGRENGDWDRTFGNLPAKAMVNVNVADIYREPSGRSERVSQALINEVVEVSREDRRFAWIKQPDGYSGWIRKNFLSQYRDFEGDGPFFVTANLASAYISPDKGSRRATSLPYGCELYGETSGNFLKIESDRYGSMFVGFDEISKKEAGFMAAVPDSESLCTEGEKFIGAPYLWGGRTFFGIDCSGFTQIILKRFGYDVPRDSKDQMKVGIEIKREDIRAGDLLFFPRHVTLAVSGTLMIHSTNSNAGVAYNSLDPDNPLYSEYHDKNFIMARRIIE